KRGAEVAVASSVLIVGIIGLYFAFGMPLGVHFSQNSDYGQITLPSSSYEIDAYDFSATGYFAMPSAKSYGGAISGVLEPGARAFTGRAGEMPNLNCYTCSCAGVKYTSPEKGPAQNACREYCGGDISQIKEGAC
ncbi:hypothetical protein D6825_03690, partial [Candidatus Woesearchaeota archaeon]